MCVDEWPPGIRVRLNALGRSRFPQSSGNEWETELVKHRTNANRLLVCVHRIAPTWSAVREHWAPQFLEKVPLSRSVREAQDQHDAYRDIPLTPEQQKAWDATVQRGIDDVIASDTEIESIDRVTRSTAEVPTPKRPGRKFIGNALERIYYAANAINQRLHPWCDYCDLDEDYHPPDPHSARDAVRHAIRWIGEFFDRFAVMANPELSVTIYGMDRTSPTWTYATLDDEIQFFREDSDD